MKKTISVALALLTVTAAVAATPDKKFAKTIDKELDFAKQQSMLMYDSVKNLEDRLVNTTSENGGGELATCPSADWVAGFFPGTLWYLYENTGDETVRAAAETMTARMAPEQYNTSNHDVGFMMNCSYGNGLRLTGREDYRDVLIQTGKSLSTRFNPAVGCTRSWDHHGDWDFVVIIDNMMNLELLNVVSSLTGDLSYTNIAKTHANTTMKNHFRPDYSTFHAINYDGKTGEILGKYTVQGYRDDSAWARGQSWGLYGYTMMYRSTGDKSYLDQAVNIGKYLMNQPALPKDKIPYWDYNVEVTKDTPRDASSACIMASALIELSTYVDDAKLSQQFLDLAEQQLTSLSKAPYRAKLGENANFILKHSTANKPNNTFDRPLVYADYYYVEALMRYKRLLEGKPVVDVVAPVTTNADRQYWISALTHIAHPLLSNLAAGTLKKNMPFESLSAADENRHAVSYLEALGRTIHGISSWLSLGADNTPEGRLRAVYIDLAQKAITNAVDPKSPDFLEFTGAHGGQPLVDAAFLCQGILRAPKQLWDGLSKTAQDNLVAALKSSREITPGQTNWLLFASTVEAFLLDKTGEYDSARLMEGVDKFLMAGWYKGDGWYGDGAEFHLDFYNSIVIQPMLTDCLVILKKHDIAEGTHLERQLLREQRLSAELERLISPEGTYPAVGRSITYRFGSFHALAHTALLGNLPETLPAPQARCAMTAVLKRQLSTPGNFDKDGWLTVGFSGSQINMSEAYINTGSQHMCCAFFLPLGLPETDPFWTGKAMEWTNLKAWKGIDVGADHALRDSKAIPQW